VDKDFHGEIEAAVCNEECARNYMLRVKRLMTVEELRGEEAR
jgi:hypothetical protein